MRILLVEPDLSENGAIRVSLDRAARWQALGADVTFFVVRHTPDALRAQVPAGLRVRHATAGPRRLRRLLPAALLRLCAQALRSDVVVAGREVDIALLLAALVARLTGRPFAVTVQSRVDTALAEFASARVRPLAVLALTRAHLAVCVARGAVAPLVRLGLPADRAAVVTNGVDVAAVRALAAAEPDVPLPPGRFVVASGRLTHQKGFDLLVRAHARVLAAGGPEHSLVILGEGQDEESLRALARESGCAATVHLPGFTANPHAVVARAEAFILSSRWEGYPLVLAEALCSGTPVIAADCVAGPSEVLDGGALGELVPPEDVPALATALAGHLADPGPLRARAALGAASAAERFDPQRAAREHLELLGALRPRRRGPRGGHHAVLPRRRAATAGSLEG